MQGRSFQAIEKQTGGGLRKGRMPIAKQQSHSTPCEPAFMELDSKTY